MREAVQDYRDSTDLLAEFFESHCDFGPDWVVVKTAFYEAYLAYCENNKIRKPLTKQKFNEDLRGRDEIIGGQDPDPKKRTRIWKGLRLRGIKGSAENAHYLRTCTRCDNEYGCPISKERRDDKTCEIFKPSA